MAQSSRYYKIDDDILLEFIYHDQGNAGFYDIDVDNNGSEVKIVNTVLGDPTEARHLIHELGSDVVNFDVTTDMGYVAIESFAARSLLLEVGKTYKFDLTSISNPGDFSVTGNSVGSPLNGNIYTYIPNAVGAFKYELVGYTGGKATVSNVANPLFATPDEETGNSVKTGSGSIERYHGIEITDGKYALIDTANNLLNSGWAGSDLAEVNASQLYAFNNITKIRYDKVRLHLRSGFSFASRNKEGFIFEVKTNRDGGVQNFLTQIVYLNTSSFEIKNPKPFILGELLYSSFIEVKLPTLVNQYSDFTDWFYNDGTGVSNLDPTSNYDISLKLIDQIEDNTSAVDYAYTGEETNLMVSREDEFQDFTCVVEEAEDGDYFKIYGQKSGSAADFEAHILQRIFESSDDISVIFDIQVFEQLGSSFVETATVELIQVEDFEEGVEFRPIIKNGNNATSFSIDVTMRIYNQTENTQIVKTASIISNTPARYGKKMMKLNITSGNTVTKIYNTLPNLQGTRSVSASINNALPKQQVKYVPAFIERMNIVAGIGNVTIENGDIVDGANASSLEISPFDTYIKFTISKIEGGENKALSFANLKNVKLYFSNGSNFNSITTFKDIDMSNGELLFKIDKANASKIQGLNDKKYYISIDNGSTETMVYQGDFVNV